MNIILRNGKTRVENQTKLYPAESEKTRTYANKLRLKFLQKISSLNGTAKTLVRPANFYKRISTTPKLNCFELDFRLISANSSHRRSISFCSAYAQSTHVQYLISKKGPNHRLNMELDLQS